MRKKPSLIISLVWILCPLLIIAQSNVSSGDYVVGKTYTLQSEILKEEITLQVHLPKTYPSTVKRYPALFLLDGQDNFLHGVSTSNALSQKSLSPEFLVIGIVTEGKQRNTWAFSQKENFMEALEKEVVTFIDQNFRASEERIIFGWEGTGGLVIELFTQKPHLFSAYLGASPTPIYSPYFPMYQKEFEALENTLTSNQVTGKFLYVTQSHQDFPVQYGIDNLIELLESKAPESLRWVYKKLEDERHPMTPFNTIFHGMEAYFFNYPGFEVRDFEAFKQKGGLAYIDTYYKERAERFDFSKEENDRAHKRMRRAMVIAAISEDNFEAFEAFIKAFESDGFWDEQYLNQAYWYGWYYLQNQKPEKAMEVFNFLAQKHEDSPRPFHGKGLVYRYKRDYQNAQKQFQKAVDMGKAIKDWRLSEYETDLDNIKGKISGN